MFCTRKLFHKWNAWQTWGYLTPIRMRNCERCLKTEYKKATRIELEANLKQALNVDLLAGYVEQVEEN